MSQLGRISGPLLKGNLLRQGVDLAFETDLLYLDVKNLRVGIKTATPQYDLDVNGTTRTTNLELTNSLTVGNLTFGNNSITTAQGDINLNPAGGGAVFAGKLTADEIDIYNNIISTNTSNAPLEFRPHGTGSVDIYSNTQVNGSLHVTGNITADGNIQIGDQATDTVTFTAEVVSDIVPLTNEFYSLGTDPSSGGKRWNNVWAKNLYADAIYTTNLVVNGIDLTLRQGKIYYVATNGADTYSGTHQNDPFGSVAKALSVATAGETVYIYPGTYTETFPLTVPAGVTVKGASLRSVKIQPTTGTRNKDAFRLNGETTIEDITVANFEYDAVNNTGHAFVFAPNFRVTTRSPYIKNVTVLTFGSSVRLGTNASYDPRGYLAGDAGRGAFADGSLANSASIKASMLFHSVTFITPGADALKATNGVRIEWLNSFTYFASKSMYLYSSSSGFAGAGNTRLEFTPSSGTFNVGDTITYYDTNGSTVLASGTIASVSGNIYSLNTKRLGFQTITDRPGKVVTAVGDAKLSTAQKKFGTASLSLDGTGDYVTVPSQTDFEFGTGDFTIECWVYRTNTSLTEGYIDFRTAGTQYAPLIYVAGTTLYYFVNGANRINATALTSTNTWYHIAVTRVSATNSTKMFVNGTQVGSTWTDTSTYIQSSVTIGANYAGASSVNGYIDDVRISKGVARYTSNFTAPTLALTGDNNTVLLLHFNGTNGSTVISDDGITLQDIRSSSGGRATLFANVDYTDFGAELRAIGSASVYGDYGVYGDGDGVIAYLIGQNLAYIGTTYRTDNDPTAVVQAHEITKLNRAKIYYNSVDHKGDFRVGDLFYINQQTGNVTFSNSNLSVTGNITLDDGAGHVTLVQPTKVETGNIRISGNTISSTVGDINVTAYSNQINLQSNVSVAGNLDVTGDVTIGGNITIGDQTTDTVTVTAKVTSDIIPKTDSTYNLGSSSLRWQDLYTARVTTDSLDIWYNRITTTNSNADLELGAAGTGRVYIPSNNLTVENNLSVGGTTSLKGTTITGTLTQTGNQTITGNTTQTGSFLLNGALTANNLFLQKLSLQQNTITTTSGNDNLVLSANGTGSIYVPSNNVIFDRNLTVNGTLNLNNLSVSSTITAGKFSTGDIQIEGNLITTTLSSSNLELRANGAALVYVPSNNVQLDQNLTVNGSTYLKNTNLTGTFNQTGNSTRTGNVYQTGNYSVTGSITIGDYAQFTDVRINNNSITTTIGNNDLSLQASGTGKVIVPNNNVALSRNLTVVGSTTTANLTSTGTVTAPTITDGDITLSGNTVTTSLSNSNLVLKAHGTGKIYVPSNNVTITNNLTVNGSSTLSSVAVSGTITHTGNTVQTGNLTENGNFTLNGVMNVSGISNFANVRVQTNTISSISGNSDLILTAAGTGRVTFPSSSVYVQNNLTVGGTVTATSAVINQNLVTDNLSNGNIDIQGNLITTTLSNSDLELRANGAGTVSVPNNAVSLGQGLTVNGTTALGNTTITGTVTQTGNVTQTGTVTQTGNYNVNGFFNVSGPAQFKDILIKDNYITTTLGNNDLQLQAQGTGKVLVPFSNVLMSQDLTVNGTTTAGALIADTSVTAPTFNIGSILINGGTITTTASNANLQLTASGSGFIEIEQVFVRNNTISTQSNQDLVLQPNGTGIVNINSVQSVKLPAGNDSQRPIGQAGMVRYNTTSGGYEGFDGSNWRRLDGVYSLSQATYITAELTPGANDGVIRFYSSNAVVADLNSSRLRVPSLDAGDINITSDTISSVTANANITFSPAGTGSTVIGNFAFRQNTITNTIGDSVTYFNQTGNGYFKIAGTNGFVIPSGLSTERGGIVETGMMRFNTTDNRMEIYNGTAWVSAAGASTGVTITEATDLSIVNALIFG
jgi:Concanavalin A-like lectin/glucanases superfamily